MYRHDLGVILQASKDNESYGAKNSGLHLQPSWNIKMAASKSQ